MRLTWLSPGSHRELGQPDLRFWAWMSAAWCWVGTYKALTRASTACELAVAADLT